MGRGLLDAILLFLVPFAVYGLVLAMRRRYPFVLKAWTDGPLARLVVAGLVLAILGIIATGILSERYRGTYVPAHLENHVLVPGRME